MNRFVLSIFRRIKKTLSSCFINTKLRKLNISKSRKKRRKCLRKEQRRNLLLEREQDNKESLRLNENRSS